MKYFLYVLFMAIHIILINVTHATTIDKIIMFGDSLSDNGNVYKLTKDLHKVVPLIPVLPRNPPYHEGRFSNGLVWVEFLSQEMNVPLTNYAYGGAWAESIFDTRQLIPFSLNLQVAQFLTSSLLDFEKDKHLYIIWIGANDYVKRCYGIFGQPNIDDITTKIVNSIESQMDWLILAGAKHFLIFNLPDLSVAPEVIEQGPDKAALLAELTKSHNAKFAKMISKIQSKHSELNLVSIDVTNQFNDIITNPAQYQIKNVSDPCYQGGYMLRSLKANLNQETVIEAQRKVGMDIVNNPVLQLAYLNSIAAQNGYKACSNPNDYLFWDHLHPTSTIHKHVATVALNVLRSHGINSQ